MPPADQPAHVPLRRIIRLFVPYRGRLAAVFALIITSALLGMVSPFLLRGIMDIALPDHRNGLLSVLAGGMLAIVLTVTVLGVFQSYLSLSVGQHVMNDLRIAVYAHLQRMSLAFFTRTRNGEVQSRIANDIGGMTATVTSVSTTVVSSVTTLIASLVAMVTLDWRLTLISLPMLPLFMWITRNVGEERREFTFRKQQQLAVMSTLVEESLSVNGFLLGRVSGRTNMLIQEFGRQSGTLTDLNVQASMAGRWRQSTLQIIMAAMPIGIYWAAGLVDRGSWSVSVGTLVAFTTVQQALFTPSVQLLQIGITIQGSLALFERVFEYLDMPVGVAESSRPTAIPAPRGHVRFEGVSFSHGDDHVLRDVDIDLPAGEHLAIVGSSGAGKTTLGYLVPRLYDVTDGRITIDGVDVRDLSFATLADIVGVVSQDTHLFHTTIADNLRFAHPEATDDELVAAARAAQIHDLISGLPEGYQTIVGERGHRFSGGEKQRLAIARTMLRNPQVLILDEATSALDTHTESAVQRALDVLSAGRTTITIAHRLSTVREADQIVVLEKGVVVEHGTHDELVARSGRYAELMP
ncbi:ABC transporter ATP-binding protein/permease [Streptomyces sp. NBC_00190]|uniref:ABC transporter ATP-binding protein n=1 Tax=Streptomyces sp. NBC_00190 TaxID=2903634 RepID=UPI002E2E56E9|nr:ABC transporter ATP-binding protein [Streptomyces sp. NBC_00190]